MTHEFYATQSMTGFATRKSKWQDWEATWELKSVNNRFLDASLRLPEWLRAIETDARSIITSKIRRGRVEATLTVRRIDETACKLTINQPILEALRQTLDDIQQTKGLALTPPSTLDLLKWPGVIIEAEIDREALILSLLSLLNETLFDLIASRQTEGQSIGGLITQRCDSILVHVDSAKQRMPQVMQLIRERLKSRVQELINDVDQDRLEQEVVYYAQKLDVAEELDRLCVHITEMKRSLKISEPVGRRLDFLTQELNREANTLGSKSQDADMTRASVDIKVLIEQIKEQVQNVE